MLSQPQRNLQVMILSHDLQRLADRLLPDRNAARFLVHETLVAAFAAPSDARPMAARGRDLRRSMVARLRAGRGPSQRPGHQARRQAAK
ncbi:MAG: hypothetical protein J7521_00175 [Caulobacter sp.]|nr:hypothetical protein [Caulobacter sp.]